MDSHIITILLFFNLIFYTISIDEKHYETGDPSQLDNTSQSSEPVTETEEEEAFYMPNKLNRIPRIIVKGSHYEVGYIIGNTFKSIIEDFLVAYKPLKKYLEIYGTSDGELIFEQTFDATNSFFPQYITELRGIADGANVKFEKLFLIHMDDIILPDTENSSNNFDISSSSLIVNRLNKYQFIAHNEDALKETLNEIYIVNAHIIPGSDEIGGKFAIREERWEAMTYAGMLSGYPSGHNHHGLVFTIDTIFAKNPLKNKIPRGFLTRALLASKANIEEIKQILTNESVGTANAFHVNVGILNIDITNSLFYSIEVTPSSSEDKNESIVNVTPILSDSTSFHVNRLQTISNCPEKNESGWKISEAKKSRYEVLTSNKMVENLDDILNILGDTEEKESEIYRDRENDFVQTIHTGVFDFIDKQWIIWTKNPKISSPITKLPLVFSDMTYNSEIHLHND